VADHVSGHGFKYDCRVGFSEDERSQPQSVVVDFDARTDWRASGLDDRAHSIVDYAEVDRAILALVSGREWRLIEAMAEAIARLICTGFPVDQVCVTVTKRPADMPHCDGVSVACSRTPADYVAL
jgi:dihydroneopterin aldolase